MICQYGSSSWAVVRDNGIYTINKQFGFHEHDDGNKTYRPLLPLPDAEMDDDVASISALPDRGGMWLALVTLDGIIYRAYTNKAFGGKWSEWAVDGENPK